MTNWKGETWTLGEEEVKQVNDFTYLGVTFGKRSGWGPMESKLATKTMEE